MYNFMRYNIHVCCFKLIELTIQDNDIIKESIALSLQWLLFINSAWCDGDDGSVLCILLLLTTVLFSSFL